MGRTVKAPGAPTTSVGQHAEAPAADPIPSAPMRVAVTGATGFTGGHTLAALTAAGHDIKALVRSSTKLDAACKVHGLDVMDHVVGDVTDPTAVARLLDGCDALIHTAAVAATHRSMDATIRATNEPATRLVLEAGASAGLDPIVHLSSISAIHPPPGGQYRDDGPLNPDAWGAYAQSKVASERIARRLQDEGHPVVIVWPSGINGPDDVGLSVGAEGMARLLSSGTLPLSSTGGMLMHDVRDLAQVLVRLIEPGHGPRSYGAFGHFRSWPDMGNIVQQVSGATLRTPSVPPWLLRGVGKFGDVLGRIGVDFPIDGAATDFMVSTVPGDDQRTQHDLDITWRPIEETLADTMRWLVEQGHLDPEHAPALAS